VFAPDVSCFFPSGVVGAFTAAAGGGGCAGAGAGARVARGRWVGRAAGCFSGAGSGAGSAEGVRAGAAGGGAEAVDVGTGWISPVKLCRSAVGPCNHAPNVVVAAITTTATAANTAHGATPADRPRGSRAG